MAKSDDEESMTYEEEDNFTHDSDEEGEDIGYGRKGNPIDDDDDEEEEEEEDEEEARKIAEGFIVDDEEESDASDEVTVRRKKRKKVDDYDEDLDEEDLELLEENTGIKINRSTGPKLKRLKRGREEQTYKKAKRSDNIFSDEDEEAEDIAESTSRDVHRHDQYEEEYDNRASYRHRDTYDDMGDFIADEDEDDLNEVLGGSGPNRGYADDRGGRGRVNKDMMNILPAGISEDVLVDMYDIFGDGGDYEWALYDDEENEATKEREPQLADIFEPSELAERMMTKKDEEIRSRDVPERLQMRYEGFNKPFEQATNDEVQEEGAWIARIMANHRGQEQPTDQFTSAVAYVVSFFTREFLEVPHIKDHRRDYFTEIDKATGLTKEILTEKDLWEIYDLDFKYHSFVDRRNTLKEFIAKCQIDDEYINTMMNRAERVEEITDLTDFINMKFSDKINTMQQQTRGPKRPTNKSLYELSRNSKMHEFLPRFGITAKEFGSNFMEGNRRHFPEDSTVDPVVEADMYTDQSFSDAQKILKACRSVLAQEISYDPQVRKAMRKDFESYAIISVKPTEKGYNVIDELHPMHPFKFLTNKPITEFKDGQFLHILKGEDDNLLKVNINISDYSAWFDRICEFYISDGYSDSVQQWNEQRKQIIEQALKEYLMPLMSKYVREKLRIEAQEAICQASFNSLYNKINVGPFRGPESQFKSSLPRVITVSSGNGGNKDPIVAVFVNQRGKVLDQIEVPNLKDDRYWKEMSDFIKSKKANVLGIAGYNAETRRVIKHMQTMISEINQYNEQNGISKMDMVVVDDEAARLYKNSRRAQEEFADFSETMRYCVSLARRLQSPVWEYAGLGRDLLAIHYHDLQHLVPEDTLFSYLERALISVVNDLGFDINAAIQNSYLASALQYVCGFGPRKAQSILKKIEATGELESRTALVLRKLTPANTFMNCASYLRIRDIDGADILDDTRIHPQDYELARKMAADALEIDEDEMDDYDSKVAVVTRVIKEYPDKLNDLILDDYAVVLRKQYNAPKRQILEHIKLELQGPYHDRRQRYSRPTTEEAFIMVTGETRQTLSEGFIIPAMVVAIRGKFANCVLDSGLEGMIYIDNVADERIMNVSDVLQVGQTVNCKVLRIDRDKFMVDLSCKPSDTKPGSDFNLRKLPEDPYYDRVEETKEREEHRASSRRKQARSTRVIKHPLFRPFNHIEAEEYLSTRQRGDIVIRPSSHGYDHIAITWKVDDDIYQHVDVVEVKNKNDIHAPARLKIGNYTFEDLDELIVTYIEAVARKVEELMAHPKYRPGGIRALNDHLTAQTQANPKMSAYGFKLSVRGPPMRWVVRVLPDGYRLRDVSYPQVDDLINGFKHIQVAEAQRHKKRSMNRY
ncbi:SH2 domain-containing protein [Cokeromyces recurvatus]|uniref:SH2 domain-containing protein n=1 Tax=Cokeromyces recurvatus TaxID=90255 RepID=UPI00221EAEFE|nr:SH2 domain-containing protein [Cokeromyces recurvatus]KAI7905581.1 SH2 domain-containing protein [Cokeromyces recurvatus]